MGKESKLRRGVVSTQDGGTRYEYTNGQKKLYDKDKMPDGLDSDIWSLVLYFEQLAEENGYKTPGRPVVYTELYHRVSKDKDFSGILPESLDKPVPDSVYSRSRGTCGIYSILEDMITHYWDTMYTNTGNDSKQCINDFCSTTVFNYIKQFIIDSNNRRELLTTGIRKPQVDREIRPSRRTEEEKEVAAIKTRKYSEEELTGKMRDFKERNK